MTPAGSSSGYRFGEFELQPNEHRLLAAGHTVRVGRHAFNLLVVLVERSGHLVTKDQLLESVWPRAVVEDNTLQAHVSALRKILGADAIATVSGRGYRFTLAVTQVDDAAAPGAPPRHNLPQPLTSFVGRDRQVAELTRLLANTRLMTLTGAGGCGKTRLALHVATTQRRRYADGVWLVELAALSNPAMVPQALATVLGVKEQPGRSLTETLCTHIGARRMLLVLDNAEHVLGVTAQAVDTLLRACGGLAILVTSRERLGIAGERTCRVPSLDVPDDAAATDQERAAACESVRLFVERARLQRPHFALDADNVRSVSAICRRLEGIPLAIELAASRVRSMSVDEIARRIDHRFALLTGGAPRSLPHHRTLRALIDWSYDLLTAAEKNVLHRMSVFAGGCTLDAAERVLARDDVAAADVIEHLYSLVDKSLLVADEHDGATRYGMLDTVRHYALDQLRDSGDEAPARQQHLRCYLDLAERFSAGVRNGEDVATWLERIQRDHDNMRAALSWSTMATGDAATGLRLAGWIAWFWAVRGYPGEGRDWLAKLLAIPDQRDAEVRARALLGATTLALQQGDDTAAQALGEESVATFRSIGHASGTSHALRSLGNVFLSRGDLATARRLKEESLSIARSLGNRGDAGEVLGVIGEIALEQGDHAAARAMLEECLGIAGERNDRRTIAWTLSRLARVSLALAAPADARDKLRQALAIIREVGDSWGTASFLEWFAAATSALGAPASAAQCWGAAERLREQIGAPMPPADRAHHDGHIAAARAALADDAAFDRHWQEGRAMTTEQAVQYALDVAP